MLVAKASNALVEPIHELQYYIEISVSHMYKCEL